MYAYCVNQQFTFNEIQYNIGSTLNAQDAAPIIASGDYAGFLTRVGVPDTGPNALSQ